MFELCHMLDTKLGTTPHHTTTFSNISRSCGVSTVVAFSLLDRCKGRFRIFILPPALDAAILSATSAWPGNSSAHSVVMFLVFAAMLQLGYLCGAFLVRARAPVYRGKCTVVRWPGLWLGASQRRMADSSGA